MSNIDNGGPAFPVPSNAFNDMEGMSLRDHFAGLAMQGLLANPSMTPVHAHQDNTPTEIAEATTVFAYIVADEMLAARKGGAA